MAGKRKEEEELVNQVTGLLQVIKTRVKIVCKSRNWLLVEAIQIMDPRNSMIKENCSVIIVESMVILQLNVGELIIVATLDKFSRKVKHI